MEDEPCQQWRREAAACTYSSEDESIDNPAFVLRYPAGDELVSRRVNHSFAGAQREPNGDQQHHRLGDAGGYQRGDRGGNTPPHYPQRNHQPWTKARGEPSRGNLKAGIANEKRAEDPTQVLVAQAVL